MADKQTESSGIASLWRRWRSATASRKILSAAVLILIFDVLARVVSVAKELMVAAYFGTGDDLDAFLMALAVPAFLINVIGASFGSAVIPAYIRATERQGREAAQRLLSGMILLSGAAVLTALAILSVLGPFLLTRLATGFNPEKLKLALNLFYMLLPAVLISAFSSVLISVLNSKERFAIAVFVPAAIPLCLIGALIFGQPLQGYALALGTVSGYAAEAIVLTMVCRRHQIQLMSRWSLTPELRQVIGQYIPVLGGSILMNSATLVDQSMAAMLPSGSISSLSYAYKVIAMPLSLAQMALGTAAIPYFSKMAINQEWPELKKTVDQYLKVIFLSGAVLVVLLFSLSKPVVAVIYQRGLFTPADTLLVSQILTCFAIQIPFYVGCIILVRLISSIRANQVLFWVSLINALTNITLNVILMKKMGAAGIALSTSFVYLVSFLMLFAYSRKMFRAQERVQSRSGL